jgi:AcrR family transcriptional regulator
MAGVEESSEEDVDRSRMGRPRRLSTKGIVASAIELADEEGLDGLSMPKLARRLGVGTMTLYGYVESKDDLLDRIAERIFEGLRLRGGDDWRLSLFEFFSDFREAALAHPTLAQLLATGRITIPAVFDILEASFRQMTEDDMAIEDAVRVFYAALTYTVGFVLWELPRAHMQAQDDYAAQWAGLLSQLDPGAFPILTGEAAAVVETVASDRQFAWGLERMLEG